ncbi:MAG TPA: GNAT family N-acetyltransferase [Propionibacteriaceae bacterium]
MAIEIRRAVVDDWPAIREVRLEALSVAPLAFGSTLAREVAFPDSTWQQRAESSLTFLARQGTRVVGTATGLAEPESDTHTMSVVAMYVRAEARGTGCAHRLLDAVAEAASATGASWLRLDVTETNLAAVRCYRRHGFRETGRRRPLPHTPELTEIEMTLELGSDHPRPAVGRSCPQRTARPMGTVRPRS